MDIIITDNWLKDFLDTAAKPKKIADCLSLCGPSVEKIEKSKSDILYFIEVTTNRPDSASVYGIAREAAAILPRFDIRAKLSPVKTSSKQTFSKTVDYLKVKVDHKLCPRFTAILVRDVQIKPSPDYIQKRLSAVGSRPINNIVDISNYIMYELGQPVHTFDYDKIKDSQMVLRKARRGEKITTLDGSKHVLVGGDIVIEDGSKKLIDLAGIMGGENSAVDKNTKNVLLFVQTYEPTQIRRTYMREALRTDAAVLFEKGLDPEMVPVAIKRGVDLFVKMTKGKPEAKILDLYPKPYKEETITTNHEFITSHLGIDIKKSEISKFLKSLGFGASWQGNDIICKVPSYRARDVSIPEDLGEEIARIYGYHNLPSKLMAGKLPQQISNSPFDFELKIKRILAGFGATEIYTLSLVDEKSAGKNALKLKNPLGADSSFLRTSLMPSLVQAVKDNAGEKDPFHLFEIANVYIPKNNNLPEETMMLAGIFSGYNYREAKGEVEALLRKLNIDYKFVQEDEKDFAVSRCLNIYSGKKYLGSFGFLQNSKLIYYEFQTKTLKEYYKEFTSYKPVPKYPAQIENLTLVLPEKTKVGNVIQSIKSTNRHVSSIKLIDIYKDSYSFRISYQDPKKTLTNKEVEKIRKDILSKLEKKFGISEKSTH